jgi:Pep3/Vps18/deep orange family
VYHGTLSYDPAVEDHIESARFLQYPSLAVSPGGDAQELPLSLVATEFHYVLLYQDRVIGICNLDDEKTYEEVLPIVSDPYDCLSPDASTLIRNLAKPCEVLPQTLSVRLTGYLPTSRCLSW